MRVKIWFATALLVISTATIALAQEMKHEMSMPPEQKAAMDAMMKAMTPGDAHKLLNTMAGSWNVKVTMWMAPGAEPTVSSGTAEIKWILGNRDLEERFHGEFMGMPFIGIGYTGYDNVKKEYWGTWMDNMSTGVMKMTGTTADQGKSWKFTGTNADPVTGKDQVSEERVTIADADHHTMEMYGPGTDGKMFKMMEIAYSRKK
jgi:Protein of unknown function (DUF1579)